MKMITKKDGRRQKFRREKLVNSITQAFCAIDGVIGDYALEKASNIADYIEKELENDPKPTSERIGNMIENGLMSCKRKDVAKAYILFRNERDKHRLENTDLMKNVTVKIKALNVVNQNANVDEQSFGGREGEAASELLKQYALDYVMSDKSKQNHLSNEIYIHDISAYASGKHNCLSIPFDHLLANGFNTRQTDIRPAKSINTAFQLVAVIFQLQSLQQFGGVSATHLDWTMVPYVRRSFYKHFTDGLKFLNHIDKDFSYIDEPIDSVSYKEFGSEVYDYAMEMTQRELTQAVEGLLHNLNTLQSRSGNQLPFTSINFGTCTLPEGRMVIKSLLEGSIKGVGKHHRTPIFPCSIFQMMKGVNRAPGDPNYDLYQLALKSTAQRLYPNYINCDWSVNAGYDENDPKTFCSSMGCRTYNGFDINADEGVNPQIKDGRGNIAPVTIIMPTLAMKALEQTRLVAADEELMGRESNVLIDNFLSILDNKIDEAKDMLIERYEYICSQSPESAKFMYENDVMLGYRPEEGIRSALKHGTLAIGQIGLAETLQILIGKNHLSEEGMELAKRIEALFKKRCSEFKQTYKLNFGVYMTPAESLCYTSMQKFKAKYGEIKNVSDRDYFTNSIHVPVWEEVDPFTKIDVESQLTGYSSAGCITYVELDSGAKNNLQALEQIVNYAMDHDIPYFAINVPNDSCLDCGYTDEFNDHCPECGSSNIQQLRRVTGYLSTTYKHFNKGKQAEVTDRVQHSKFVPVENHD